MKRLAVLPLATVAAAALAAPAGAQTTLATERAPTPVAAWDGTVAWSSLDPATGKYRLLVSTGGGAPQEVAIPQRDGAFDVDLGTNRNGSTYAVYTRDGDLYRLKIGTAHEQRLTKLSSPRLDERDPTIMRGRIAFIRGEHGRDHLRIGDTTSGSKGTRRLVSARSIPGAELGASHVSYVEIDGRERQVHVRNVRTGADRVIHRARSGGANFANVTRPSVTEDLRAFVFARTNLGSQTGNRLYRYTLRGSRLEAAQGSPRYASTGWASAELGAVTFTTLTGELRGDVCEDAGQRYCEVALTGPVPFARGRAG